MRFSGGTSLCKYHRAGNQQQRGHDWHLAHGGCFTAPFPALSRSLRGGRGQQGAAKDLTERGPPAGRGGAVAPHSRW